MTAVIVKQHRYSLVKVRRTIGQDEACKTEHKQADSGNYLRTQTVREDHTTSLHRTLDLWTLML